MPKYNSPSITTLALTTASQLSKIQIKASHLSKETFTLDTTSIHKAVSDSYISSPFFSKTYPIFICSQATGSGVSKEMGKKYFLILSQVQTIRSGPNTEINRSWGTYSPSEAFMS